MHECLSYCDENSGYEVEMSSAAPCKVHLLVLHKILASPM